MKNKRYYLGKEGMIAFHPSYYIESYLKEKNMTFWDLVKGEDTLFKIKMIKFINGKVNLDDRIAYLLSNKFDTSIQLWWNLDRQYKKNLLKIKKNNKNG